MLDDARLTAMADEIADVEGVVAVALGGSRARGTHHVDSDVDVGVFYRADALDVAGLAALAARWSEVASPFAAPGGWGRWVDGGAWLRVDGTAVDWILRDADRVEDQCERAQRGVFAFHAQAGHPFGFLDVAYAGEVAMSVALSDREGMLARAKSRLIPYPDSLRTSMLSALWQVDFLLGGAEKGARRGDAVFVSLCCAHAALLIAHGWHAAAGAWVVNEKGAVPEVERLPIETQGFAAAATAALASRGAAPDDLLAMVAAVRALPRPVA